MQRKILIILTAITVFGPALLVLYSASTRWARPAAKYPDFHATWAIVSIICGYIGLLTALDLVLQVLRPGRRLSHSVWLCSGIAAGCVAAFLSLWMMWLTPLRLWLLIVNGLAITGLFYLLYRCRRRFELRLFGWAFAIAGLALFAFALQEVYAIAGMGTWAKTQGRITHSGRVSSRQSKFWTEQLAYEYFVDGQRHTGGEDSWKSSRMRYGWGWNLDRTCASYGWNGEVAVHYDPLQPERAVLRPGLSYATAFGLKASLMSVLGGMALLVASAQIRQVKAPMPRRDGTATGVVRRLGEGHWVESWAGWMALAVLMVCAILIITCIQPIAHDAMEIPTVAVIPATADEFCLRGLELLWKQEPKRASNNLSRALRLDPNYAEAYYNRGHAFAQLGQIPQAVGDWKKATELNWHMAFRVYYARRTLPSSDAELDQMVAKVALDHLGDLEEVSGYAVGAMGEPGEFYTASLILSACLSDEDFLRMADSQNPVACAMALIVLARRDLARYQATIRSFYDETTEIMYMPVGCNVSATSLGALARNIIEDPNTLRYWAPEKTNWGSEESK